MFVKLIILKRRHDLNSSCGSALIEWDNDNYVLIKFLAVFMVYDLPEA